MLIALVAPIAVLLGGCFGRGGGDSDPYTTERIGARVVLDSNGGSTVPNLAHYQEYTMRLSQRNQWFDEMHANPRTHTFQQPASPTRQYHRFDGWQGYV